MPQQLGRELYIQISDMASPGPAVFNNLCGLKTRSFNLSANEVDHSIVHEENFPPRHR